MTLMTLIFLYILYSLSGQVFGCLSDTFADCTNYETELKPLTTNVGKMCYPNGSVSEELQNSESSNVILVVNFIMYSLSKIKCKLEALYVLLN